MKSHLSKKEKKNKIQHFLNLYYSNVNNFKINNLPSWISFFAYTLQKEINNDLPKHYRIYGPGEVVLVNFGVSIGQELCGIHFAVVLNRKDSKYNSTLLVVPLSSKYHEDYVSLDRELADSMKYTVVKSHLEIAKKVDSANKDANNFFKALNNFHNSSIKATAKEIELLKSISFLPASNEDYKNNTEVAKKNLQILLNSLSKVKDDKAYPVINKYISILEFISQSTKVYEKIQSNILKANHFFEETKKHDNQTFAAINNIKTISKLRLVSFYDRELVDKIFVSNKSLDKIKKSLESLI